MNDNTNTPNQLTNVLRQVSGCTPPANIPKRVVVPPDVIVFDRTVCVTHGPTTPYNQNMRWQLNHEDACATILAMLAALERAKPATPEARAAVTNLFQSLRTFGTPNAATMAS